MGHYPSADDCYCAVRGAADTADNVARRHRGLLAASASAAAGDICVAAFIAAKR